MWSLPCIAHDKDFAVWKMVFAVCNWHTANFVSPVVTYPFQAPWWWGGEEWGG